MNTLIKFKKVYSKDLDYIDIIHGQVLYCIDTLETYYDNEDLYRTNITVNAIYLESESDKNNIYSPLINRIYMIGDTLKIYYSLDNVWYPIETEKDLYDIILNLNDLTPTILQNKQDEFIAPRTIASAVYMNDGSRLSTVMKNPNILTVTRTKAVYVEVVKDNQRIFTIPYPIGNYDLARNHISFIVRGNLYEPSRYVINNDRLILNTTNSTLMKGETVLFIFYYTVALDLNDNVVLDTKNYGDKTITSEKLADSFKIDANRVIENVERIFMTPEERDKLRGVAYNATNYHHPDTHPATMIVEDEEHRFVSDVQIYNWDHKANANEVYTKEEADQKIEDLIGAAPDALDTLVELANSINNDPDFVGTMYKKLDTKADKTQVEEIHTILESKIDVDDYVRGAVYNTASVTRSVDGDFYNIQLKDDALQEYIDGMQVVIKIKETNQMSAYIQINQLGYRKIVTQEQYDLIKGELLANSIYTLRYNGVTGNFILQGKGGVKINHSSLKDYEVYTGENITRGDIVDIIEGTKVRNSMPTLGLHATTYSAINKHYCSKDLRVNFLDINRILVTWIDNEHLKAQVFKIDAKTRKVIINDLQDPLVLNNECINYDVCILNPNKVIFTYADKIKKFYIMFSDINDTEFEVGVPTEYEDIEYTTCSKIIKLNNNRAIITWKTGELTKCIYTHTTGKVLNKISERTNLNYPIDHVVKVNETQILFAGLNNTMVQGWVMNIDFADFYNNTLINIRISDTNEKYKNMSLVQLEGLDVAIFYTDEGLTKQYRQNITIEENGGISIKPHSIISIEDLANNYIGKYKKFDTNIYVKVSNKDGLNTNVEKITKEAITNIDTNIALFNLSYVLVDFDILDNSLIVVYSNKLSGDNNHLFFSEYSIKRNPNGIAMKTGIEKETIPVSVWK